MAKMQDDKAEVQPIRSKPEHESKAETKNAKRHMQGVKQAEDNTTQSKNTAKLKPLNTHRS